jgi:hypothetical protein
MCKCAHVYVYFQGQEKKKKRQKEKSKTIQKVEDIHHTSRDTEREKREREREREREGEWRMCEGCCEIEKRNDREEEEEELGVDTMSDCAPIEHVLPFWSAIRMVWGSVVF